jgi:hypothetical protein
VIANGQDDRTFNQALLEHFTPGKTLNLKIELPRQLFYSDLEHISKLLINQKVDILKLELSNIPYTHTLNVIFVRPSIKRGYQINDWQPMKALSSFLTPLQNWELAESR